MSKTSVQRKRGVQRAQAKTKDKNILQFLREHDVPTHVEEMLHQNGTLQIAVPFWGEGAIKTLGLKRGNGVQIICNLESRACNPYVIEALLRMKFQVRSHGRLHAKIYLAGDMAIIGSSNASTNGLLYEASDTKGWIEANVLTNNSDVVKDAQTLFDDLWKPQSSNKVTLKGSLLKAAKLAWDNKPPRLPPIGSPPKSILEACRKNPEAFKNVLLTVYSEDLGPEGKEELEKVRATTNNVYGYQFELRPGSWLIDLDCTKDKARVWGCAHAPIAPFRHKLKSEDDLFVAIRGQIKLPGYSRFRLASHEKRLLEENAALIWKLAKDDQFVPLPQALMAIDRRATSRSHARKSKFRARTAAQRLDRQR